MILDASSLPSFLKDLFLCVIVAATSGIIFKKSWHFPAYQTINFMCLLGEFILNNRF